MAGMNKYIVALAALVLIGCGPKEDQFIDTKAASERQAKGELLLDIREADDYKEFHIPSSTNIPFGHLTRRLAELDAYKGKPIIVIDHSGLRSPRAWEQLKKAGFTQVTIVNGGIAEWKKAGLPLDTLGMQLETERLQKERQQQEIDQLEWELEQLKKQEQ
ncbi:MAG: rhodanese-like domain-containing protein [Gammaproteobacteria bacterium]|nr:rhodanese-like domain-containing protein [Gammaproteobacteria bacterium]MBU1623601.1 rhodanese-like domain-containing protein [Gammaproteobacteria bacterium]